MSTTMNTKSEVEQPKQSQKSGSDLDSQEKDSTARKILKFAGTWQGNDLEECLEEVYRTRGETIF
jgi:hypothetical protein